MPIAHIARRAVAPLARALPRFVRREEGTSAIEFAIILPAFLLPAWFGFAEIAVMQERTTVLNTTTSMVADMISQYQAVSQERMTEVMSTAQYVLGVDTDASPDFTMVVMGVVVPAAVPAGDPQKDPYVAWSMDRAGGSVACGTKVELPPGVATPTATDRTVIVAEGTLNYSSPFLWDSDRSSKGFDRSDGGQGEVTADGWLKVIGQPLRHRAIYAPRRVSNPTGPNPCPPPGTT